MIRIQYFSQKNNKNEQFYPTIGLQFVHGLLQAVTFTAQVKYLSKHISLKRSRAHNID